MMRYGMILSLILVVGGVPAAWSGEKEGFEPLFNGTDLTGWEVVGGNAKVWGVDHGIVFVQAGGGGWLMTRKEYADFEIRLEYRMTRMGNSGVGLRAPHEGDPAYQGMEIQLLDDANYKGLKPAQYTGSIYGVVPPSRHVSKPAGEWNAIDILAQGRHIRVELNGTVIVDANLDDHKDKAREHPGILRTRGHIALQSHTDRVEFRHVSLKPL